MQEKTPFKILLVGKTNVGKSTLFNALLRRSAAITSDEEHTTRDFQQAWMQVDNRVCILSDSSGVELRKAKDTSLTRACTERVKAEMARADLILFMAEAKAITASDKRLATEIRRCETPFIFCLSKADRLGLDDDVQVAYTLGLGEPLLISSTTSLGLKQLRRCIVERADALEAGKEALIEMPMTYAYTVSLLGRPNVGKSALMNLLMERDHSLVSEVQGTTRDSVEGIVRWHLHGEEENIRFIDTAGMRKKSVKKGTLEVMSLGKTLAALRQSEVGLLIVDAAEGITAQDKKILSVLLNHGKSFLVVANKWDLLKRTLAHPNKEAERSLWSEFQHRMSYHLPYLKNCVVMKGSASAKDVASRRAYRRALLEAVSKAHSEQKTSFQTAHLNKIVQELLKANPPKRHPYGTFKVYYAVQTHHCPYRLRMYVNNKNLMEKDYESYLKNGLEKRQGLRRVAVQLDMVNKKP